MKELYWKYRQDAKKINEKRTRLADKIYTFLEESKILIDDEKEIFIVELALIMAARGISGALLEESVDEFIFNCSISTDVRET